MASSCISLPPSFLPSLLSIPLPPFSLSLASFLYFSLSIFWCFFWGTNFIWEILIGFFYQRTKYYFLNQEFFLDSIYNQAWLMILVPDWPLLLLVCSKQRKPVLEGRPYQKAPRRPEGFNFCCSYISLLATASKMSHWIIRQLRHKLIKFINFSS